MKSSNSFLDVAIKATIAENLCIGSGLLMSTGEFKNNEINKPLLIRILLPWVLSSVTIPEKLL